MICRRRMRLDMSVRCVPSSGRASQIGQVPRTSWGSVFALARVCTAPMQPHYFTHYYSRMFVRISALTLDAMGVCVRACVCQGSTRSPGPPGGRFSPLHASPARRCTRVRSPTDYDACSCAYVQPHSMQCVCAANLRVRGITLSTQNCAQAGSCSQGGLGHINKHNSESSTLRTNSLGPQGTCVRASAGCCEI